MDNNIGKRLDGRYELLELIGVGGMADIYKARDMVEGKIVAVKILKNELAENEDFLRRFRNESKAIALLSHPNIVKIFDVGFSDKVQFIVMEYIDGITLTEYIERQGILKWRDALHFITQILRALQHAHDRGIVHRDIKSQNVMLLSDGAIKVMDFGIARFNRETDKTISEKAIGSVHYISPEQARGEATDEKSDIYSVGVMLFEMLTGKKPFDGDNPVSIALLHMQTQPKKPKEINASIPDGLEEITLKAMQKEPAKRYQTAGEMINDIDEFKKNPSIVFEYKYFGADQNTKYFDKAQAASASVAEKRNGKNEVIPAKNVPPVQSSFYDDDDDDFYDEVVERRSPLLSILFATASVFVIMAAWLIFQIVTNTIVDPAHGGRQIQMPQLVGRDFDEVLSEYPDLTLVAEQEYSSEFERGQIIWQSADPGREIRTSQQIEIKVSIGPRLVELNNYEGLHINEATERIKRQGLPDPQIKREESMSVPADFVIRTTPPAGERIQMDTVVTVWVSFGSLDTEKTNVPNIINLSLQNAEEHAKMYDVNLVVYEEYSDTVAVGTVIRQNPLPLVSVDKFSDVEAWVSTGPRPNKSGEISHTLTNPAITGDYRFEYYIDGVLQEDLTRTQNMGLNKEIRWDVEGAGVHRYAINITSLETGKSGLFCEWEFNFTGAEPTKTQIQFNGGIFTYLSTPDAPTTTTPPPDPEYPGYSEAYNDENYFDNY
ncbi:MAG: Stk1 family PASTA domain-containing Ser/Thr kinase [Oscillospiraceae bacterium]|nr:Stk1 family PASTA domain-containing Ser/Thr kinase [Oscillospiraceae bacterium]